jgi:hypothetical protein
VCNIPMSLRESPTVISKLQAFLADNRHQAIDIPDLTLDELAHLPESWGGYIKERATFLSNAYPFFDEPKKLEAFKDKANILLTWEELVSWAKNTMGVTMREKVNNTDLDIPYSDDDLNRTWRKMEIMEMDAFRRGMEEQRHQLCDLIRTLDAKVAKMMTTVIKGELVLCLNLKGSHCHRWKEVEGYASSLI